MEMGQAVSSDDLLIRRRKQQDQDDVMHAIAEIILARRHSGREQVFPKYFYCNTRTWEDEVAPEVAHYLQEMGIEVRTSTWIPWDKFAFTQQPRDPHDIGKSLRQGITIGKMI